MADVHATGSEDAVLVCGLGRLGRACLAALRGYRVPVAGVDLTRLDLSSHEVDALTVGDLRSPDTLHAAGIARCRAVLFVARDTKANMQGALAARHLNPTIRIVVRAEQQTRYETLSRHLGDFVTYAPHQLAAASFGLAALDSEVVAHFFVRERLFQVIEHSVHPSDDRLGRTVESAENLDTRILLHVSASTAADSVPPLALQRWQPEARIARGDRLLLLSARAPASSSRLAVPPGSPDTHERPWSMLLAGRALRPTSQEGQIALGGLLTILVLLACSTSLFRHEVPRLSLGEAFRNSLLLLLSNGHLSDVLVGIDAATHSLRWAEVLLTMSGTVLTVVLYALLTNRLLATRFQLLTRRPKPAARGHVLIAGLGRAGQETAAFLAQLGRKVVTIERGPVDPSVLPRLPLVHGSATDLTTLARAHIDAAVGVVAATGEDLINVEIALLARSLNPDCGLVVRLLDPRLVASVATLLPQAQVLCIFSLAATAFAAAALGEHVSHVFRLEHAHVLVTEYAIEETDALHGLALWEVAEGYGVVPILLERPSSGRRIWSMEDPLFRLRPADRLIVLATAASLEAIERGERAPRSFSLRLERALPFAEPLQIVGALRRSLDCTLAEAHALLRSMPTTMPERVYPIHALRTKHLLESSGVQVTVACAD